MSDLINLELDLIPSDFTSASVLLLACFLGHLEHLTPDDVSRNTGAQHTRASVPSEDLQFQTTTLLPE